MIKIHSQPIHSLGFLIKGAIFDPYTVLKPFTTMHMLRTLAIAFVFSLSSALWAQVNTKGTIYASLGIAGGAHATHYEQTTFVLGIPFVTKDDDGAATVTFPIQVGYGFADWFSLGLIIEPGNYLDSNATRTNGLFTFGVVPRFYLVNKDRFAWSASLQLGGSGLRIDDSAPINSSATYKGANFGLGTGVGFYFTDHIGLNIEARYLANSFTLREYSVNGSTISLDNFDAVLTTRGVLLQASLAFKF